jgi:hypothetical protein
MTNNSTLKKIAMLGKKIKNELATLLIKMDLDLDNDFDFDRMCTLIIHPYISSTCTHTLNEPH